MARQQTKVRATGISTADGLTGTACQLVASIKDWLLPVQRAGHRASGAVVSCGSAAFVGS
jgi:hypothetical protein